MSAAARAEPQPALRVSSLGRRFGGVHAVSGIDLAVMPGERRAVIGPNGAGKTTLFNLIAGEIPPTEGRVELFGRDVTRMPVHRRVRLGLGRTYQTSRVLQGLDVADNLYLAALGTRRGHSRIVPSRSDRVLRERARAVAHAVGLTDRLHTSAGLLSHGEQRQLEIGLALAPAPRLLLFDEPAAGLSRAERVRLTDMLLKLDRQVTLIIVEHDMDVALTVARRVTILHRGELLMEGTPDEVRASREVHDVYLGNGHVGR